VPTVTVETEQRILVSWKPLFASLQINLLTLESFAMLIAIVVPVAESEEANIFLATALALLSHCSVEIESSLVPVPLRVALLTAILSATLWVSFRISWALVSIPAEAFMKLAQRLFCTAIHANLGFSHQILRRLFYQRI
jgi:hypothetical protein